MFSVYEPVRLPYEHLLNWNLECQITRIHNAAVLVHDYGGSSVAITMPTKCADYTAELVVRCFEAAGYKVHITLSSRALNTTIFNLEWVRKDGRHAENQSNISRTFFG